jgi:hypothetical protein
MKTYKFNVGDTIKPILRAPQKTTNNDNAVVFMVTEIDVTGSIYTLVLLATHETHQDYVLTKHYLAKEAVEIQYQHV